MHFIVRGWTWDFGEGGGGLMRASEREREREGEKGERERGRRSNREVIITEIRMKLRIHRKVINQGPHLT